MPDPLWINVGLGSLIGNATIAANDELTITAHGLDNGDPVMVDNLSGGAIGVLFTETVYYVRDVTANTFRLAGSEGGNVKDFLSGGSANVYFAIPAYTARELRRAQAMFLFPGTSDGFGARSGVRPSGQVAASITGTAWTVHDLTAVVYTGVTSITGPYVVQHVAESGATTPADGTNDRIDALDLQIQDDDEDAETFRRGHIVYVTGDPGAPPSEPALTSHSVRIATIDVQSGGTPGPAIDALGFFTVASGGILPVRGDAELPASGMHDMMAVGDILTGQVKVWFNSAWQPIGSAGGQSFLGQEIFTSGGTFEIADYPGAQSVVVHVQGGGGGGGGCSMADVDGASVGAGGAGGQYRRGRILAGSLAASETVTIGGAGLGGANGSSAGTAGGSSIFGPHITAVGGGAGQSDATSGPGTAIRTGGSASSSGGSGGDIAIPGGAGQNGIHGGGFVSQQGNGGASVFSMGGRASSTNDGANGPDGPGFGAGGSGGHDNLTGTRTARSGGNGGAGIIIVEIWG